MADIQKTLDKRAASYNKYGSYSDHAILTQRLKQAVRDHAGWNDTPGDMQESIDMIFHKIARVLNGEHTYKDNWHDIVGYAKLVDDQLT